MLAIDQNREGDTIDKEREEREGDRERKLPFNGQIWSCKRVGERDRAKDEDEVRERGLYSINNFD